MKLYDNDAYREKFMEIVYGILSNDETNDRANQIIDAFDNAPQVETEDLLANDPLTLEQLREMDGEPVWVEVFVKGIKSHWGIVHGNYISDGKLPNEKGKCLLLISDTGGYNVAWLAYRCKPEENAT